MEEVSAETSKLYDYIKGNSTFCLGIDEEAEGERTKGEGRGRLGNFALSLGDEEAEGAWRMDEKSRRSSSRRTKSIEEEFVWAFEGTLKVRLGDF